MLLTTLKTVPKAPQGIDKKRWTDTCNRIIEATGSLYKSDLGYVQMYCASFARWEQATKEADQFPMYNDAGKLNEPYRFETELAVKVKQYYRALENTVLERVRANKAGSGELGWKAGVKRKGARGEGPRGPEVPSAKPSAKPVKKSDTGISWLDAIKDDAAAKNSDSAP